MRTLIAICAGFGIFALVGNFIRMEMLFREDEKRILYWLRLHPEWHYGLDLVKAGLTGREMVYVFLGHLEEKGMVQVQRVGNDPAGLVHRPLFRATPHEELLE